MTLDGQLLTSTSSSGSADFSNNAVFAGTSDYQCSELYPGHIDCPGMGLAGRSGLEGAAVTGTSG
jgi:hypothetical protein